MNRLNPMPRGVRISIHLFHCPPNHHSCSFGISEAFHHFPVPRFGFHNRYSFINRLSQGLNVLHAAAVEPSEREQFIRSFATHFHSMLAYIYYLQHTLLETQIFISRIWWRHISRHLVIGRHIKWRQLADRI